MSNHFELAEFWVKAVEHAKKFGLEAEFIEFALRELCGSKLVVQQGNKSYDNLFYGKEDHYNLDKILYVFLIH